VRHAIYGRPGPTYLEIPVKQDFSSSLFQWLSLISEVWNSRPMSLQRQFRKNKLYSHWVVRPLQSLQLLLKQFEKRSPFWRTQHVPLLSLEKVHFFTFLVSHLDLFIQSSYLKSFW
jgi:hypothetical protein